MLIPDIYGGLINCSHCPVCFICKTALISQTLWGNCYWCANFTEGKIKSQESSLICSGWQLIVIALEF